MILDISESLYVALNLSFLHFLEIRLLGLLELPLKIDKKLILSWKFK